MKKIILILTVILLSISIYAQRRMDSRHELGALLGVSYYLGDLNPSSPFLNSHPAIGLIYRYNINYHWTFKFNGYYGKISGDDANNPDTKWKYRNLNFESELVDIGAQLELNFLKYMTGSKKYKFSPFIFGGISIFHFNPKASFGGKTYELQRMGTEGQGTTAYPDREKYSLTAVAIPFGIGVKWSVSNSICLGFEWGMRKTFTDYIDDVSTTYADATALRAENTSTSAYLANREFEKEQLDFYYTEDGENFDNYLLLFNGAERTDKQRGDASNDDWYSFAGLTITFKLKGAKSAICPAYDNNQNYRDYR